MLENTHALRTDLRCTDGARDIRIIDLQLAAIGITDQGADFLRIVRAGIHHGQKDPFDPQLRIDLPLDLVDGLKQLLQAFCRQIIGLHGNEYLVGSGQCIDRKHSEGRHTVQQDVVVLTFYRFQVLFENGLTAHGIHQRDLQTHGFVFVLFVFCGKVFAHLPGLPPVTLPLFLLRGLLGALAVIAAQLVLAMVIRSFAVPIFLGLLGGITGIFISSKGFGLLWPYSLMQLGMNSNKSADALVGSYGLFAFSCIFWLGTMFLLAWLLLKKRDVRA